VALDTILTCIAALITSFACAILATGHPDADHAYVAGQAVSSKHPKIAGMFPQGTIPPGHPDVDALLRSPKAHPLPSWHDSLESLLIRRSEIKVVIPTWAGEHAATPQFALKNGARVVVGPFVIIPLHDCTPIVALQVTPTPTKRTRPAKGFRASIRKSPGYSPPVPYPLVTSTWTRCCGTP